MGIALFYWWVEPEFWDLVIFHILCYLHCVFISPGGSLNWSTWLRNLQLILLYIWQCKQATLQIALVILISFCFLTGSEETLFPLIFSQKCKKSCTFRQLCLFYLIFPPFILAYEYRNQVRSKICLLCWVLSMQGNNFILKGLLYALQKLDKRISV